MNIPVRTPNPWPDETAPEWSISPSTFDWQVLIYGGENPRTGFEQPQLEVQFHKRQRVGGSGYSARSILHRANDFAKGEHRTHFAVRDTDGSVIYDGPVLNEIEAPVVIARLTDDQLVAHSADRRRFGRASA
jgi:hypothetical protein